MASAVLLALLFLGRRLDEVVTAIMAWMPRRLRRIRALPVAVEAGACATGADVAAGEAGAAAVSATAAVGDAATTMVNSGAAAAMVNSGAAAATVDGDAAVGEGAGATAGEIIGVLRARLAAVSSEGAVVGLVVISLFLYLLLAFAQRALQADGSYTTTTPATAGRVAVDLLACAVTTAGIIATYAGVIAFSRRPALPSRAVQVLLAAPIAFGLCLLFARPAFSVDVLSYIAHGAAGSIVPGGNAYSVPPALVASTPIGAVLGSLGWLPQPFVSPYGPLWSVLETLVTALPGVAAQILLFKVIAFASIFVSGALAWQILGLVRPGWRLVGTVALVWNPVLIGELAGEGHNDGLMVTFTLLGLWGILRARPAVGIIGIALGALVKYLPLMLAPPGRGLPVANRVEQGALIRGAALGAGAAVVVAVAAFAPFLGSRLFDGLSRAGTAGPWPTIPARCSSSSVGPSRRWTPAGRPRSCWAWSS